MKAMHAKVVLLIKLINGRPLQLNALSTQRAIPTEWYRYRTGALVIKIMMHKEPSYLWKKLFLQYYEEPRKPGLGRFLDSSKLAPSFQNHFGWMKDIDCAWHGRKLTDDAIRVLLKKSLFDYYCDLPFLAFCFIKYLFYAMIYSLQYLID
jgi:hypothetical protein